MEILLRWKRAISFLKRKIKNRFLSIFFAIHLGKDTEFLSISTLYIFLTEFCNILTYNRLYIAKVGLTSHFRDLQPIVGQEIVKIGQKNVQSREYNLQ